MIKIDLERLHQTNKDHYSKLRTWYFAYNPTHAVISGTTQTGDSL